MENTYKIYKYTNLVNGKIYIGQTKSSLKRRSQKDGKNYFGCGRFYNAIQKYGWENFKPEILADNLSLDEANQLEEYFISYYNSTNPDVGYNIFNGGLNKEMNDQTRQIISEKAKERYKDKTKNPMFGKKHSKSSLEKMSDKKVGCNNPMYGKHLSEEAKQKQRETRIKNGTNVGRIWSEEERKRKSIQQKELCKKYICKFVKCVEDNLIFQSVSEASKHYGVSVSTLSGCLNGNQHTCRGKHFVFA